MKKKTLTILIAASLAALTACGSKPVETEVNVQEASEVTEIEEKKSNEEDIMESKNESTQEETTKEEITEAEEAEVPSEDEEQDDKKSDTGGFHLVDFKKQSDGNFVGQMWDFVVLDPAEIFIEPESFVYSRPSDDDNIAIKVGDIVHGDGVSCNGEFEVISAAEVIEYYKEMEGMDNLDDVVPLDDTGHPILIEKANGTTGMYVLPLGIRTPEDRCYLIDHKCWAVNPLCVDWHVTTDWGRYGTTNPREVRFTIADDAEIDIGALSINGGYKAEFDENGEMIHKVINKQQFLDMPVYDWENESEDLPPDRFEINGVEYFTTSADLFAVGRFSGNTCTYLDLLYSP